MRALTAGRSILGGGWDDQGGKAARQVEPGVQLLILPAAPIIRSLSFGGGGEPVTEVAEKSNKLVVTAAAIPPVPVAGGTKGLIGGSLMIR